MKAEQDWYGPDTATFGDRLTGAREAAGLDVAELARRLGVQEETIHTWEDDAGEPRSNRLSMLAGLLNVSISWLLTGEGDGLGEPDAGGALSEASQEMMSELRELRLDLVSKAEQLGQLERKLRAALREGGHDGTA